MLINLLTIIWSYIYYISFKILFNSVELSIAYLKSSIIHFTLYIYNNNETGTAASKDSSLFTISGAEEVLTRLVVMKEKQQQTADDERIVKEAKKRGRVGFKHHFIDWLIDGYL